MSGNQPKAQSELPAAALERKLEAERKRAAKAVRSNPDERFLPAAQVLARYAISEMTLHRWLRHKTMDFPAPVYLGRYRYWRLSALEEWDCRQEANSGPALPESFKRSKKSNAA